VFLARARFTYAQDVATAGASQQAATRREPRQRPLPAEPAEDRE
jgi:hypothetical protein